VGPLAVASVVLIPFPFSDLSASKRRPAVVLADAGKGDWIMCMVTSNPYADAGAIRLENADFVSGSLSVVSFARPGKLFTASETLAGGTMGQLSVPCFARVRDAVVKMFGP
jgi:mRNA interferase MazF